MAQHCNELPVFGYWQIWEVKITVLFCFLVFLFSFCNSCVWACVSEPSWIFSHTSLQLTAEVSVFLSSLIVLNIYTNLLAGDCAGLHLLGHVLLDGSTRLAHLVFISIILLFCLSLLLSFLWLSCCWRTLCFTQGASWYPYPGWPTPGKMIDFGKIST